MRGCFALAAITVLFFVSACVKPIVVARNVEAEMAIEDKLRELLHAATLEMRKGDNDSLRSAESTLYLAKELRSDDARIIDALGCLAWRRNEIAAAKEYFRAAIRLNPNYDRPYAHLAFVAKHEGDQSAAKELLAIALRLNPMNYRARNNLAALFLDGDRDVQSGSDELRKIRRSTEKKDAILEHNDRYVAKLAAEAR